MKMDWKNKFRTKIEEGDFVIYENWGSEYYVKILKITETNRFKGRFAHSKQEYDQGKFVNDGDGLFPLNSCKRI